MSAFTDYMVAKGVSLANAQSVESDIIADLNALKARKTSLQSEIDTLQVEKSAINGKIDCLKEILMNNGA